MNRAIVVKKKREKSALIFRLPSMCPIEFVEYRKKTCQRRYRSDSGRKKCNRERNGLKISGNLYSLSLIVQGKRSNRKVNEKSYDDDDSEKYYKIG